MIKKYEHHKQNDYPGERVAERKRVADRAAVAESKADARVAQRAKMDSQLMDDEIQRSSARAAKIKRSTRLTNMFGLSVIGILLLVALSSISWALYDSRQNTQDINSLQLQLANSEKKNQGNAAVNNDMTPPIVAAISPANNELNVAANTQISVTFNEDIDPATINAQTVQVIQRTSPRNATFENYRSMEVTKSVAFSERTATLSVYDTLTPNQEFGNVFTVMVTTGVTDLAGNNLSDNYMWSFSTGPVMFYTDATTSQLN